MNSRELKSINSRKNLKTNGVKVKRDNAGLTFIIPKHVEENIRKHYNFNADMLNVGGDISLADLAIHMDEQASVEFHVNMMAEYVLYEYNLKQDEYEAWYNKLYYKTKEFLQKDNKTVTEKMVAARIQVKHSDEIRDKKKELRDLEFKYRILSKVISSALTTKGIMLPSLRNIIQGNNSDGIAVMPKKGKVLRSKLRMAVSKQRNIKVK